MNPLQYINKIFCTLLVFSVGNKSYSQREIHPLEPMFTYDYALKYSKNAAIRNLICNEFGVEYYFLENFRGPTNIRNIETVDSDHGSPFIGYSLIYVPDDKHLHIRKLGKIIYYYNEQSFLEKSVRIGLNDIEEIINQYYYKEENGLIKITTLDNKKYFFDKKTENLVQLINENYTINFSYSTENIYLIAKIESKNKIFNFFYNENLEKFYPLICTECYKAKDIPTQWFLIHKNKRDALHTISNVFINNQYTGYSYEKINCSNAFNHRIRTEEAFVFDNNKKLVYYEIGQSRQQTGVNAITRKIAEDIEKIDSPYPSYTYKKKNDRKWILTNIENKKLGDFKLKKNGLCFISTPIIIYNK